MPKDLPANCMRVTRRPQKNAILPASETFGCPAKNHRRIPIRHTKGLR